MRARCVCRRLFDARLYVGRVAAAPLLIVTTERARVWKCVCVCVCLYVGICVCGCVRVLGEYVGCTMWCGGDCVRCVRTTTCAVRDVHDVECG